MIANYIGFHRYNSINSLKNQSFFWQFHFRPYFCTPIKREHSSVGLEHLVYTERVRGSNPCAPTQKSLRLYRGLFLYTPIKPFKLSLPYATLYNAQ